MNRDFDVNVFLKWSIGTVCLAFFAYLVFLAYLTHANAYVHSIQSLGTLGDSFGALNCLFTGLGFAGLLTSIFMQRQDLQNSRKELEETREEVKTQSNTMYRQRFEDSFYRMLDLYKENLRNLSIRPDPNAKDRIFGIDALQFLLTKFDAAWKKHQLYKFPEKEEEKNEYLYVLAATVQSVFVRQTRYIETLISILIFVDEECNPQELKPLYWRLLASQLTAYEYKYLFYQALIAPDFTPLRNILSGSGVFQQRMAGVNIADSHRKAFEAIWGVDLPKRKSAVKSPLSTKQIRDAQRALRKKRRAARTA